MILTNTKYMIAIFAAFAMLFAGVAVADSADAEPAEGPFLVSYVVGDSTFQFSQSGSIELKDPVKDLHASIGDGLAFDKWVDDAETPAKYGVGSTYVLSKAVVFTATYTPVEFETVFMGYDANGADKVLKTVTGSTMTVDGEGAPSEAAPAISLVTALKSVDTNRAGYIFTGWMAEGSDKLVATADLGNLKGNVTYVAQYAVNYVLTFVDGTTTYKTNVDDLIVPDLGVKEGFVFLGWFVGTEQVVFNEKNGQFSTSYEFTADTTFDAKWEPVNVYVTFTAGDFSKTVPVLYGDKVAMLALPEGFTAWDFDFDTVITEDVTIEAIPAPAPEPVGMDDPVIMTMVIIGSILVGVMVFGFAVMIKKGKIVVGRGPNAKKNNDNEGDIKP